jgi:hypothetical protein
LFWRVDALSVEAYRQNEVKSMVITMPVPPDGLMDDVPAGHWVALSMDEQTLLGEAPDLDRLVAKMEAIGLKDYVLDKVPPEGLLVL